MDVEVTCYLTDAVSKGTEVGVRGRLILVKVGFGRKKKIS
jgi:hypothetical protein